MAVEPHKVFITADAVGGVWQYTLDLTRALVRAGADVMVATMGPRPDEAQREEMLAVGRVQLIESDFALEWMPNPWGDVDAASEWLLAAARDWEPEVIHLNGYAHASLLWGKPVVVVAHSCVCSWWRAVHAEPAGEEWSEYRRRVREGLLAANTVIAPSAFMASCIAHDYGLPLNRVRVIHNGSEAPLAPIRPKQNVIFAAGRRWDRAKNLDLLERIALKLDWELRIAGGQLSRPQLLTEMQRSGIFAHAALYEPFGLAVVEAARAGNCLVLSDIPSMRELWDGAAIFIDPRDEQRWISELNRLSRDGSAREDFATAAQRRSLAYNIEAFARSYLDVYRSLMMRAKSEVAA